MSVIFLLIQISEELMIFERNMMLEEKGLKKECISFKDHALRFYETCFDYLDDK